MSLVCARVRLVCLGWWRFIGGQFSEVTQHHRSRLAFHIKQNSLDIFNGESLSKLSISPYIIIYGKIIRPLENGVVFKPDIVLL